MKALLKFAIIIVFLISCKSDDSLPSCSFENPIEDLAWLKQKIKNLNSTNETIFNQATYDNKVIFIESSCCTTCNFVSLVYDCTGKQFAIVGEGGISSNDITDSKVIWKSDNCLE